MRYQVFEQNRDPSDQTLSWRISRLGYGDLMWLFMWKLAIISCSVGFRAGNGRKGTKIIACRRQSRDVTDRYLYFFIFLFICRIYLFILYIYLIHLFKIIYCLLSAVRRPHPPSVTAFYKLPFHGQVHFLKYDSFYRLPFHGSSTF